MILVFVRIGEWITRAQRVSFSVPEMLRVFKDSPVKFMQEFGMTGLHAVIAWVVIGPILVAALYYGLLPALRKMSKLYKPTPANAA